MTWLHIIGIGEDGMDGLTAEARALVESAEVIIGGDRHHKLSPNVTAERLKWPSPFNAMIDEIRQRFTMASANCQLCSWPMITITAAMIVKR